MSYSILTTLQFEKEIKRLVKKYPSLKNELSKLVSKIIAFPESGSFIGNNCYKIRIGIESKGKGKSGGARIITYLYTAEKTIYLLTIYDKSEKEDLKPNELKDMINGLQLQ